MLAHMVAVPLDVIAAGVNAIPPEMFMLWIGGMIFVFVIVPAIVAAMKSDPEPQWPKYSPPGKDTFVTNGALVTRGPNERVHIAYILSDGRVATRCDTSTAYANDGFLRPSTTAMSTTCYWCAESTTVKSGPEFDPRAYGKRAFALGSDDFDKDGNPVAKKKPQPPKS